MTDRSFLIPPVSNIDTGAIVIQRDRDVVRQKRATSTGPTDGVGWLVYPIEYTLSFWALRRSESAG